MPIRTKNYYYINKVKRLQNRYDKVKKYYLGKYNQVKMMYDQAIKEKEGIMKSYLTELRDLNEKLLRCERSLKGNIIPISSEVKRVLIGEYNSEFNLKILTEIPEDRFYNFVINPYELNDIDIDKIKRFLEFLDKIYDKIKIISLVLLSGNEERNIGLNCGFSDVHFKVVIISIIQKIGFYTALSEFYNIKIYLDLEHLRIGVESD